MNYAITLRLLMSFGKKVDNNVLIKVQMMKMHV